MKNEFESAAGGRSGYMSLYMLIYENEFSTVIFRPFYASDRAAVQVQVDQFLLETGVDAEQVIAVRPYPCGFTLLSNALPGHIKLPPG